MKIRLFSIRFIDLGLGGCNGKKKIWFFYNRGNCTIYELKGGGEQFFICISGGQTIFLCISRGPTIFYIILGGEQIFNSIFYVWPHTCHYTIASSLRDACRNSSIMGIWDTVETLVSLPSYAKRSQTPAKHTHEAK